MLDMRHKSDGNVEGAAIDEIECSTFKQRVIPAAIRSRYVSDSRPIVAFVDIPGVRNTIASLKSAFPRHFQHMFAAKANSMRRALTLVRQEGIGCEVASPGELEQALRVGFQPAQIVYDEPAKTRLVLNRILENGISLTIDNFEEFDLVSLLLEKTRSISRIGFRINPQVGAGFIDAMSTATNTSKFGIALDDTGNRSKLVDTYRKHSWLTTLHTHVGSQGCSLALMCSGIGKVVALADEINAALGVRQIDTIDIGGGLSVNFRSEDRTPTFEAYATLLREHAPALFTGEYRVITEFGRAIYAKNGFIASRVEYTKSSGGRRIAICHAGAQIATRTTFMPDQWRLRLSVFDSKGRLKTDNLSSHDVAGPCCFAGDLIARARELPLIEAGDYLVLHDTGAYYFSNPYYYNCLPAIAVYGVTHGEDVRLAFSIWRKEQNIDTVLATIG